MTLTSIIMMVVAMVTIWGGLLAAILNLYLRPDPSLGDDELDDPVTSPALHPQA